jgi:hypothetical protein
LGLGSTLARACTVEKGTAREQLSQAKAVLHGIVVRKLQNRAVEKDTYSLLEVRVLRSWKGPRSKTVQIAARPVSTGVLDVGGEYLIYAWKGDRAREGASLVTDEVARNTSELDIDREARELGQPGWISAEYRKRENLR